MRVLCVGRHAYLSGHLCQFFGDLGLETRPAVGFREAMELASGYDPELVLCDYDLLATLPLGCWEGDPLLSRLPVIAVSLTRRPDEVHLMDVNGIAGFLYLPTLQREDALRLVTAVHSRLRVDRSPSLSWPGHAPSAALP